MASKKKQHSCEWRTTATELKASLAESEAKFQALMARVNALEHKHALATKALIGPKSERMPTPEEEARAKGPPPTRGGHTNPEKRAANAKARAVLETTIVEHPIPDAEARCTHCGDAVVPFKGGERSVEIEWVPGRIERRVHVVETGRCPCKMHYARGPAPPRVQEGCLYGPHFLAKLAVDKCGDAIPIYRLEKSMRRAGVPIGRSSMNDALFIAADTLMPLWEAALCEVREDPHVQADETSARTQTRRERSFVWTFLSKVHTVYVFAPDRSGETPRRVLGGTVGSLVVDGFTGYNKISAVDGRHRAGCWSHGRRYLFDALGTAPEARDGLDIILELFMVERDAIAGGLAGSFEHLELRKRVSAKIITRLEAWINERLPLHEPPSPMGVALRYLKNQWPRLMTFLDDPLVPIHNNASEAALRIIALFRKNSLFFRTDDSGRRLMVLYSLVATCERHGVNPTAYLADVLIRLQDHPRDKVAELLPHRWKKTFGSGFAADRDDPAPAG